MSMTAGSGEEYRRELSRLGFILSCAGTARKWLGDYLSTWNPRTKVLCVDKAGWHGNAFVLTDAVIGDDGGERIVLQVGGRAPRLNMQGDLAGWQKIAALAVGNSRLVFGISVALAGPLVHLLAEESGGFHLSGSTSIGKTVVLRLCASVWEGEIGNWRGTDNGVEANASARNDLVMTMDEIGQGSPLAISEISYMLGNGSGKARMTRAVGARPAATWRLLFLSSGEVGLAAKLGEIGRKPMAGQSVRLIELPADAGAGLGVFEDLHGHAGGAALAEHIRQAVVSDHGTVGRAFLAGLTANLEDRTTWLRQHRDRFVKQHCPPTAAGQVQRVLSRFALVAAAGELGIRLHVLPWPSGEAEAAALRCFKDWLEARGGIEPTEITAGIEQVQLFIEMHGSSRFEAAWANQEAVDDQVVKGRSPPNEVRTINRVGFRRLNEDGAWTYYVTPKAWREEVCRGLDPALVAKALLAKGYLEPGEFYRGIRRPDRKADVPGMKKGLRYFTVRPSILGEEDD